MKLRLHDTGRPGSSPAQPQAAITGKACLCLQPQLNHARLHTVETACAALWGNVCTAEALSEFQENYYIFCLRDCSDNKPDMEKDIAEISVVKNQSHFAE